ncbi:MAG: FIG034376: Hypothetical protein [uncultured Paraburkholderia sp.]|uniref:DUF3275 family protein n=1 Tax=uncultured Paraburkholderia sp. TaxID=1822466 RepID=UPI002593DC1D|nr:DUF3275 family protein [uncultured Paraburkholderia sp.]CAH2902138.1 MAG: FIG034376: Hypothetical protein [uncultured Paraburkholderia sp.]CAH2936457.1 MAG: FIG034376: Hypothetical protein [uncultured Paraburkholderia sp.]
MISLSGTLDVRTIKGSNGPFQVGELTTSVGEFKVKDKVLEQFEPGAYTGTSLIDKIYPHSYVWYGKVTVEIRARLADVQLDNDEPLGEVHANQIAPEPDPADEERRAAATEAITSAPADTEPPAGDVPETLADLFGTELADAILASQPLQLDRTVERSVLRRQRDELDALGYTFQASTQTWFKN